MNLLVTGAKGFAGSNLSETENLVTVMWANEQFDPKHPDTFFEVV